MRSLGLFLREICEEKNSGGRGREFEHHGMVALIGQIGRKNAAVYVEGGKSGWFLEEKKCSRARKSALWIQWITSKARILISSIITIRCLVVNTSVPRVCYRYVSFSCISLVESRILQEPLFHLLQKNNALRRPLFPLRG